MTSIPEPTPEPAPETPDAADADTAGTRADVVLALKWLAWVLGLAVLWYVIGFASLLAPSNLAGAPQGDRLALPLYPFGYGRLFVGALVAGIAIGLIGRRANRSLPAGLLAAVLAYVLTRAGLAASPQARLYGNERLVLFGTLVFALATALGLAFGAWGGRRAGRRAWRGRKAWRGLVALSVLAAVLPAYGQAVFGDLDSALTGAPPLVSGGALGVSGWLVVVGLVLLFGLAWAIAAVGRAGWLLLTAVSAVVLPVLLTVLGYLSQLIRPGIAGNIGERIVAPIADLIPALLTTAQTWWPPLAVLAGGLLGFVVGRIRGNRDSH